MYARQRAETDKQNFAGSSGYVVQRVILTKQASNQPSSYNIQFVKTVSFIVSS